MKTYIALLRGINIVGHKKIKMADLKKYIEELKFSDVKTYIQSGNIIFAYENISIKDLEKNINKKILEKYGFEVTTLVITPTELREVIAKNPFSNKDLTRVYVTFLSEVPSPNDIEKLKNIDYSPEEFRLEGKTIYFFSPHGYGKAKMNNNFFENKLNVKATSRNWKTVNKLLELANEYM